MGSLLILALPIPQGKKKNLCVLFHTLLKPSNNFTFTKKPVYIQCTQFGVLGGEYIPLKSPQLMPQTVCLWDSFHFPTGILNLIECHYHMAVTNKWFFDPFLLIHQNSQNCLVYKVLSCLPTEVIICSFPMLIWVWILYCNS